MKCKNCAYYRNGWCEKTDGYRPRGKRTPTIDEIGENQLRLEEPV